MKYNTGLVVGKFSPLHLGHQYLIDNALKECRKLVILSYSNPEFKNCEAAQRKIWLEKQYPNATVIVLDNNKMEIPTNDAPEIAHRQFVARVWVSFVGTRLDAVFTSEDYGDPFVEELNHLFSLDNFQINKVKHVLVDKKRIKVPISATQIRNDLINNFKFLSKSVKVKICLLGAESTGKSTLAQALAEKLGCDFVDEYGRTLYEEKQGKLSFEDMLHIAKTQVDKEDSKESQLIICDSSPLTTYFYSQAFFNKAVDELYQLSFRPYSFYFLCDNDFGHVQDGTREGIAFQKKQQEWYYKTLADRRISYDLLSGSVSERIAKVIKILSDT